MIRHLLRYLPAHALQWQAGQGLAVDDYGVSLDPKNVPVEMVLENYYCALIDLI